MPKRNKHAKRPSDVNELAHQLVRLSTEQSEALLPSKKQLSALMSQLGKKGGKIGGKRRMETMTSEERSLVAQKAANTRWGIKRRKA
jgi:hypothetical protein